MEYILIEPEGQLNSVQRARIITRELYNLGRPVFLQREDEAVNTYFGVIIHPDDDTRRHCLLTRQTSYQYTRAATLSAL